jgi:hypothetical protein
MYSIFVICRQFVGKLSPFNLGLDLPKNAILPLNQADHLFVNVVLSLFFRHAFHEMSGLELYDFAVDGQ